LLPPAEAARRKKKRSTVVISLNCDPYGQGRNNDSGIDSSDAADPSSAIKIFMA
jgi:hypothetical protein